MMNRLASLALFNNDKEEKSAQALLQRGQHIFGPDEKDTQYSANFLIILLDCIEKWALHFQFEDENSQGDNEFYKVYQKLIDEGVKFPSTFKGGSRGVSDTASVSGFSQSNRSRVSRSKSPMGKSAERRRKGGGASPWREQKFGTSNTVSRRTDPQLPSM